MALGDRIKQLRQQRGCSQAQLSAEDRTTIKAVLNTFIVKNRFQSLASETQKQAAAN